MPGMTEAERMEGHERADEAMEGMGAVGQADEEGEELTVVKKRLMR